MKKVDTYEQVVPIDLPPLDAQILYRDDNDNKIIAKVLSITIKGPDSQYDKTREAERTSVFLSNDTKMIFRAGQWGVDYNGAFSPIAILQVFNPFEVIAAIQKRVAKLEEEVEKNIDGLKSFNAPIA